MSNIERIKELETKIELQKMCREIVNNRTEGEIKKHKEEIEKLKNESNKDYVLEICADSDRMFFRFWNPETESHEYLGYITRHGRCNILNTEKLVKNYEIWRENGCKFSEEVVIWKNKGGYKLWNGITSGLKKKDIELVRFDIKHTAIYNFSECFYPERCVDINILRHKHNNRPIGF